MGIGDVVEENCWCGGYRLRGLDGSTLLECESSGKMGKTMWRQVRVVRWCFVDGKNSLGLKQAIKKGRLKRFGAKLFRRPWLWLMPYRL